MKRKNEIELYYNKFILTANSRKGYYQEKINFLLKELQNTDGKTKILDIGCNDGELAALYSQFGHVLGLDINNNAVLECRKRGIKCKLGDIESLGRNYNSYFDVVIASDIIEHVFDTDEFLRNIARVLKYRGKLLLTTANLASLGRRAMLLLGINPFVEYSTILPSEEFNVGHIRYYTCKDLRNQLQFNKFENIHIYGDKINFTSNISLPYQIAKFLPTFSRNFLVYAEKA